MGLRNDTVTAWKERHDRLAGIRSRQTAALSFQSAPPRSLAIPCSTGGPWNLGPRLGFAYTLTPKTVIRGGGGIFYSFKTVTSGNSLAKNAPFSGTLLTTNDANNFTAALPISGGFPAARPDSVADPRQRLLLLAAGQQNLHHVRVEFERPARTAGAMVSSSGLCGRQGHLCRCRRTEHQPADSRDPERWSAAVPIRTLAMRSAWSPGGTPRTTRCKPPSSAAWAAVRFSGSWTWAHSIDDTSGESSNSPIQNPQQSRRPARQFHLRRPAQVIGRRTPGNSLRQREALPDGGPEACRLIAGGWQLNNIASFLTGPSVHPHDADQHAEHGGGSQFPNRIASGVLPSDQRSIDRWFDASAFVAPGQYHLRQFRTKCPLWAGDEAARSLAIQELRTERERPPPGVPRRGVQRLNTPQFNNPNSASASGCRQDHQRGHSDGVPADLAPDPDGPEAVFRNCSCRPAGGSPAQAEANHQTLAAITRSRR